MSVKPVLSVYRTSIKLQLVNYEAMFGISVCKFLSINMHIKATRSVRSFSSLTRLTVFSTGKSASWYFIAVLNILWLIKIVHFTEQEYTVCCVVGQNLVSVSRLSMFYGNMDNPVDCNRP